MIKFLILYLYQSSLWLKDIYKLHLQRHQPTDYTFELVLAGLGQSYRAVIFIALVTSKNSWRPSSLSS